MRSKTVEWFVLVAAASLVGACDNADTLPHLRARTDAKIAADAGSLRPDSDALATDAAQSEPDAFVGDGSVRDSAVRDSSVVCIEEDAGVLSEDCDDWIEGDVEERTRLIVQDDPAHILTTIPASNGIALHVETRSRLPVRLRFLLPDGQRNLADKAEMRFQMRTKNTAGWWGTGSPGVTFEDHRGRRRLLSPAKALPWDDGVRWQTIRVPFEEAPGWTASGAAIDFGEIRAVEISAFAANGFTLDVDALRFVGAGSACERCSSCSGHGRYQRIDRQCICEPAYAGDTCEQCAPSFVMQDGRCVLPMDGDYDYWPNPVSRTNSDAWLVLHHDAIRLLRPKLLVLNFVNAMAPAEANEFVGDVLRGIREASKSRGYEDPSAEPQLDYDVRKIVDLRDGVNGRPRPPSGYGYENSTLFPRVQRAGGALAFDYALLHDRRMADLYEIEDPEAGGELVGLCTAVERGLINELWFIAVDRGDNADAVPFEVLEQKAVYDRGGQRVPGVMSACAGNGCFEGHVPVCGRSLRVMVLYYDYHPGLALHLFGHAVEGQAAALPLSRSTRAVPALTEWFLPFGGFDLDVRYGLPFASLYDGCGFGGCVRFTGRAATFTYNDRDYSVDPYAAVCGNVHYPPNGSASYRYYSLTPVMSSCASFGMDSEDLVPVSAAAWAVYSKWMPSDGGDYLIWWFQHMPAYGSGHRYEDGRTMPSVWPFLFY